MPGRMEKLETTSRVSFAISRHERSAVASIFSSGSDSCFCWTACSRLARTHGKPCHAAARLSALDVCLAALLAICSRAPLADVLGTGRNRLRPYGFVSTLPAPKGSLYSSPPKSVQRLTASSWPFSFAHCTGCKPCHREATSAPSDRRASAHSVLPCIHASTRGVAPSVSLDSTLACACSSSLTQPTSPSDTATFRSGSPSSSTVFASAPPDASSQSTSAWIPSSTALHSRRPVSASSLRSIRRAKHRSRTFAIVSRMSSGRPLVRSNASCSRWCSRSPCCSSELMGEPTHFQALFTWRSLCHNGWRLAARGKQTLISNRAGLVHATRQ